MTIGLQAIVFDFDGVIANSEPLHLLAFQRTSHEYGITLTGDEYYKKYLGYDDLGMIEALARDRRIPMSDREIAAFIARKGSYMQQLLESGGLLFPGAKEFIQAAAAQVPIAIASGALRHEIEEILVSAGLDRLFTAIVASGDTPESKPSPAPYLLAFHRLKHETGRELDPRRSAAIEDSRWGLESARGAGLRCVAVTNSYPAHELPGAELLVNGLENLTLPMLDDLCRSDET